jgi:hypothetical protein
MVLVVTGGGSATAAANRAAVLSTWADNHTYFVTLDAGVPEERRIRLPAAAESGGRSRLFVKVLAMWAHVAEVYAHQYDFFLKADDDTYVNLPRLQRELAGMDPDVPAYFGAKRFSASLVGTGRPMPLWPLKSSLKFGHGGAGYLLSRGALRALGAAGFRACLTSPPRTTLEDAKLAACVYAGLGLDCVDMASPSFGGLDVLQNRHDQEKLKGSIAAMPARQLALAGSFHSVQAEVQHLIHQRRSLFLASPAEADRFHRQILSQAEARLHQAPSGRWASMFACNYSDPAAEGHDAPRTAQAACARSLYGARAYEAADHRGLAPAPGLALPGLPHPACAAHGGALVLLLVVLEATLATSLDATYQSLRATTPCASMVVLHWKTDVQTPALRSTVGRQPSSPFLLTSLRLCQRLQLLPGHPISLTRTVIVSPPPYLLGHCCRCQRCGSCPWCRRLGAKISPGPSPCAMRKPFRPASRPGHIRCMWCWLWRQQCSSTAWCPC